ncbi:MAG: glycoside hydrolase family 97 protein [Candidatus Hinthialibacter antarcticus]|nr:glycoside hydrolase family 97 protein [Candidatus Hinthialibacter antarcticus]
MVSILKRNSVFPMTFAIIIMLAGVAFQSNAVEEVQPLESPDGRLVVHFTLTDKLHYAFEFNGQSITKPSPISLTINDGVVLGAKPKFLNAKLQNKKETITSPLNINSNIQDEYNLLTMQFEGGYAVEARAYNDGWAYRIVTSLPGKDKVFDEEFSIQLAQDFSIYASYAVSQNWITNYEAYYEKHPVSEWKPGKISVMPIVIDAGPKATIGVTEADIYSYPSMHITRDKRNKTTLEGRFPAYPIEFKYGGHRNRITIPTKRAKYIAKTKLDRALPWRVFITAETPSKLLENDLVFRLSRAPQAGSDYSWVKPGKAAWEWWCNLNIIGVDFEAGFNTESYKYYIDFAADYGMEYILIDEGWYENNDVTDLADALDMDALMSHAQQRGVGVILWCMTDVLDNQWDDAIQLFKRWGVKGLKVDFFDRDDQQMIDRIEQIAKQCAESRLTLDYHGVTKPTGLRRTYPNVLTREAVRAMEYSKLSDDSATPEHNTTVPFTRMLAGPLDYTPGAMRNVPLADYQKSFNFPVSIGTRCAQLAMYVVYFSPLQMISGSLTAYRNDDDTMDFLSAVPTVWDETVALEGRIGELALLARRSGDEWYVGGLAGNESQDVQLDLSFLGKGKYTADIYRDGANAHRNGADFVRESKQVNQDSVLKIQMAPGGGLAIRITQHANTPMR